MHGSSPGISGSSSCTWLQSTTHGSAEGSSLRASRQRSASQSSGNDEANAAATNSAVRHTNRRISC